MLPDSDYKKLIAPESIALVGVTSRTGRGSNSPLEVLLKRGYGGGFIRLIQKEEQF